MIPYNRLNIRLSHPTLYYAVTILAVMNVLLGLNFWFGPPPTFNPLEWPYLYVGAGFFTLGVLKLLILNVVRNLILLRVLMAAELGVAFAWGCGATITGFQGRSSFQLPIVYAAIVAFEWVFMFEPPVNPLTQKETQDLQ